MAKLTLSAIATFVSDVAAKLTYSQNNDLIEAALENTLSRDGTTPNTMSANLDMNSKKVINLADPTSGSDAVSKTYGDANYQTGEKGDKGDTGADGPAGSGSGDVIGPGSSTDNAIVRYNLGTGTSVQDSGVLVDDSDNVSGVGNLTLSGTVDGRDVATDGTKLDAVASGAEVNPAVVSQSDAEAGTATDERIWTSERVKQSIVALGSSSKLVQVSNVQTGAVATGTTTMPVDDTIPQITEGDEYMTLVVTPSDTSNILMIEVVVNASHSTNNNILVALFQDTTANALAANGLRNATADIFNIVTFTHKMTAGTTSSTTFRVRIGANQAGTMTFNGFAGARKLGGVLASSITIWEYKV